MVQTDLSIFIYNSLAKFQDFQSLEAAKILIFMKERAFLSLCFNFTSDPSAEFKSGTIEEEIGLGQVRYNRRMCWSGSFSMQ